MSLSDVCGEGKIWSQHEHAWCDCTRKQHTFVLTLPVVDDDAALADMAPALALMRADPLGGGDAPFTFSAHFEAWPDMWRRNAIGVLTRGEWPMSEPLP